jgi:hypothetical protein
LDLYYSQLQTFEVTQEVDYTSKFMNDIVVGESSDYDFGTFVIELLYKKKQVKKARVI